MQDGIKPAVQVNFGDESGYSVPLRHSHILAPILPVSSESKIEAKHSKDENHQNKIDGLVCEHAVTGILGIVAGFK